MQHRACNTVNAEQYPAVVAPTPSVAQIPSACPAANPANTGCYCTNGCSVNGDTVFPYVTTAWPPTKYGASFVGNDTICARIQVPVLATPDGVNLAAHLGITGDVYRNGTQSVNGAVAGQTVTVYTAFTAAECNSFMNVIKPVASALAADSRTSIVLCRTESCNTIEDPSVSATSGAWRVSLAALVAAAMAALL